MRWALLCCVLVLAAGCGSPGPPGDGEGEGGGTSPPTGSATVGFTFEELATGLSMPLYALPLPGTPGALAIVEQTGKALLWTNGILRDEPLLDLQGRAGAGEGEQGFLGLAFHPGYLTNGVAIASYTDAAGDSVLSRIRRSADGSRLDPGTEEVLLTVDQPFANHNGGHVLFGPDGHLYYGLGDGGLAGDPNLNGQNPHTLLGALLRLAVGETGPYTIPPGNPYADGTQGRPEVWATGLRNPWRFHFDPANGDLWLADVGQDLYEEVNRQPAGAAGLNYGWNLYEGNHHYPVDAQAAPVSSAFGFTFPVAEYSHAEGCSVTGGPVYRGAALPGLAGAVLYGDFCSGTIWRLPVATGAPEVLLETSMTISSFGVDADGEVLVLDHAAGRLLRLVPAA